MAEQTTTFQDAVTDTLSQRLRVLDDGTSKEPDRRKAVADLARVLGRRYSPDNTRLDLMHEYAKPITVAKNIVFGIVDNMRDAIGDGRNVILYGSVGTGKDRMLAAMLYAAVESGFTAHWVNGLEVYSRFRDAIDTSKREADVLPEFTKPQVLGISDPTPPFGNATDWNVATLYRVIDIRYRALKCTWLTLNCKTEDDAREQLSDRVFDRLIDGALMVPCFWPSYRERNHN